MTKGITEALDRLGAPAPVRTALLEACLALEPHVAGVVAFGDLAKGRYRGPSGEVQLAVLLREASPEALERVAPALRQAWRAIGAEPLLLTPSEVRATADVFPTKLLDIQRHHVTLLGEDPFHDLVVDPEHVRLRVEQELRNMVLRMRRSYVRVGHEDAERLRLELSDHVEALAANLAALLRLRGRDVKDDAPAAVFAQAAAAFDLDGAALTEAAALAGPHPALTARALPFARVLAAVSRAAEVADRPDLRP